MTVEQLLERQHAELRQLLRFVRDANGRVQLAFESFADAVHLHWLVEERHLHPLLERLAYPDLCKSIEAHRALRHVVDDLAGSCEAGPPFVSAIGVLATRLEQHVVDEERTVLPFLARSLSPEQNDALARAMLGTIAEIENENWIGAPNAWANHHAEM